MSWHLGVSADPKCCSTSSFDQLLHPTLPTLPTLPRVPFSIHFFKNARFWFHFWKDHYINWEDKNTTVIKLRICKKTNLAHTDDEFNWANTTFSTQNRLKHAGHVRAEKKARDYSGKGASSPENFILTVYTSENCLSVIQSISHPEKRKINLTFTTQDLIWRRQKLPSVVWKRKHDDYL